MKRILLVSAVLFSLVSHASDVERRLLVTFVSGGPIQFPNPSLRTLCGELKPYITALDGEIELVHNRDLAKRAPVDYSGYTHLAFIGHSLGGMEVHKLARMLGYNTNFAAILLITLDPVSNFFPGDQPAIRKPHRWLNVYSKKPYFHPRWKHQPYANWNNWYYLPHSQAKWMFVGRVRSEFMEFIGGPIQVQSHQDVCNFT